MARRGSAARSIDWMPGWEWQYKGESTYVNSKGKTSDAQHAVNLLTGETLSVRQTQNRQKIFARNEGIVRQQVVGRTGKTYTRRYNTERHGDAIEIFFRTLDNAEYWWKAHAGELSHYKVWVIQIQFEQKLVQGEDSHHIQYHRYQDSKGRWHRRRAAQQYDTLSKTWHTWEEMLFELSYNQRQAGLVTPWEEASERIGNYVETPGLRIRLYGAQK